MTGTDQAPQMEAWASAVFLFCSGSSISQITTFGPATDIDPRHQKTCPRAPQWRGSPGEEQPLFTTFPRLTTIDNDAQLARLLATVGAL
jgi:hypothetical protein